MTTSDTDRPARPATIYDVARVARVSHQTVSRLLKGERISAANHERVTVALAQLDYRPNIAARSLATRTTRRIAALMYEMTQLGPIKILEGASAAAREAGYVLDIVSLDPTNERSLSEAIDVVNQQDVAGILAFAPNDGMRKRLDASTFRVPLYRETEDDDTPISPTHPNVNALSADLAIGHLLELGHTRIAHISGPLDWPSARIRARSYRQAIQSRGFEVLDGYEGDWSAGSGAALARRILESVPDVTAIFAANDQMGLGALHLLHVRGVDVPGDVSVIGIDDVPEAAYYHPPLSSVAMNFRVQGEYAFRALLARLEGVEPQLKTDYVHTALVQRASTARHRSR